MENKSDYFYANHLVPDLLFWQKVILVYATGIWSYKFFEAGLLALFILLVLSFKKSNIYLNLVYILVYIFAIFVASSLYFTKPIFPDWLELNKANRIEAEVIQVQAKSDGRITLILDEVYQAQSLLSLDKKDKLHSKIAWTIEKPNITILPGQKITATLVLKTLTDFNNEGVLARSEAQYLDGIFLSAWNSTKSLDTKVDLVLSGEVNFFTQLKHNIQVKLSLALFPLPDGFMNEADKKNLDFYSNDLNREITALDKAKAMLPALFFANKYYLVQSSLDGFYAANLAHSLAISGQHLALCGLLAGFLLLLVRRIYPSIYLKISARKLLLTLSVLLALFYLWISGSPPSLVRASLMLFFSCLIAFKNENFLLADILFAAFALILVFDPFMLYDLGLQLSIMSIVGILLCKPLLYKIGNIQLQSKILTKTLRFVLVSFLITLAIQITTLPIILSSFYLVPIFPFLNLIWLPFLALFIMPISAILLILLALGLEPSWCSPIFDLICLPVQYFMTFLNYLQAKGILLQLQALIPNYPSIIAYYLALFLVAYSLGRNKVPQRANSFVALAIILFSISPIMNIYTNYSRIKDERITIRMLDVGQGEAILVELAKTRFLIDAGGAYSARFDPGRDIVAPVLCANQAPKLSFALATHKDMDHFKGMIAILKRFDVPVFYSNPQEVKSITPFAFRNLLAQRNIDYRTLGKGDVIELDEFTKLEVLHPPKENLKLSSNNQSLVLRLVYKGRGLLLVGGDIEKSAINLLLKSKQNLQADVLAMPHHASKTSLVPDFYKAVNPKLALISCGFYNNYNYPSPEVIKELEKQGIAYAISSRAPKPVKVDFIQGELIYDNSYLQDE